MPDDFTLLGALIPEAVGGLGPSQETASRNSPNAAQPPEPARDVAVVWPDVVGEDAAANSEPVRLRQGGLIVATSSSAWAQTLQFMEETIKSRLNERLGTSVVERIQFRHAGWEQRPRPVASEASGPTPGGLPDNAAQQPGSHAGERHEAPPLSPEQQAALQAVERLGLDPLLKKTIVGAMKAAFVRSQQDSVR